MNDQLDRRGAGSYTVDDFFREAEARNLTAADIFPAVVVRLAAMGDEDALTALGRSSASARDIVGPEEVVAIHIPTTIAMPSMKGLDAGPMSEWKDLVRHGLVPKDSDYVLVSDLPKIIAGAVARGIAAARSDTRISDAETS